MNREVIEGYISGIDALTGTNYIGCIGWGFVTGQTKYGITDPDTGELVRAAINSIPICYRHKLPDEVFWTVNGHGVYEGEVQEALSTLASVLKECMPAEH